MPERYEIYKCEICGNVVEVLHGGAGQLVCCRQPMSLMKVKIEEQGYEKHLPTVEKTDKGIKIKVGSIPHPMEEKHYIELIEAVTENGIIRKFLKPGQEPEAEFRTDEIKEAREYCTIHGLWSTTRR
jgi:superoxide reductase